MISQLILFAAALLSVSAYAADYSTPAHPFVVFDGLLYVGKPDLRPLGMMPIRGINPPVGAVYPSDSVDDAKVRETLVPLRDYSGAIYLDYEIWPTFRASTEEISRNIGKLLQVVRTARAAAPRARIGFYDLIPCWDYWDLVKNDRAKIAGWKECNVRIGELAREVDIVMPSLYTFYNDPQGWDIFAAAMLQAARQYDKPVYAFLWPEFHVSNRWLRGHDLPANFWRHELEFCRARADGIVIWGGYQKPWDERAAWWQETKSFLGAMNHR